jgi:hypothetical protein
MFIFAKIIGNYTVTLSIKWVEDYLLTCPSKHFFHVDCPGCGLQRSVLALFEGDLVKSFQLYPATIPIFFLFYFYGFTFKIRL